MKQTMKKLIIKIYDLGKECYQVETKISKEKTKHIIKTIKEIEEKNRIIK